MKPYLTSPNRTRQHITPQYLTVQDHTRHRQTTPHLTTQNFTIPYQTVQHLTLHHQTTPYHTSHHKTLLHQTSHYLTPQLHYVHRTMISDSNLFGFFEWGYLEFSKSPFLCRSPISNTNNPSSSFKYFFKNRWWYLVFVKSYFKIQFPFLEHWSV